MPPIPYGFVPLSDRARAWLRSKPAAIARLSGTRPAYVYAWSRGDAVPTYPHVVSMLTRCTSDGLSLEDFGYTELPTGQVARLLAPGHAPAPDLFFRASGIALCPVCDRAYHRHPVDPLRRDSNGTAYLNILCDGRRVKL